MDENYVEICLQIFSNVTFRKFPREVNIQDWDSRGMYHGQEMTQDDEIY